jgi:hypothetical protein
MNRIHDVHVKTLNHIHAMNDVYASSLLTESCLNLVFWPYRQDNGGTAVRHDKGRDPIRAIIAEMTDPTTNATLEERRETLSWCLRTFILPPERRVALETRLAALRSDGRHLRRLAGVVAGSGETACAP